MKWDSTTLSAFLTGTILSTLLLAAQAGGDPLRETAWILIGVALSVLTRGYGLHVSAYDDAGGVRYVVALARNVLRGWPTVVACLPTVFVLLMAAAFGWPADREYPDGRVTIGYTTVGLNINVLLLFFWGVISARRAGLSRPWTVLVGIMNAALGLLVVAINLALK